jgi:O-acetyl-ADP-ribose deacetylase (regulator of RNase III)
MSSVYIFGFPKDILNDSQELIQFFADSEDIVIEPIPDWSDDEDVLWLKTYDQKIEMIYSTSICYRSKDIRLTVCPQVSGCMTDGNTFNTLDLIRIVKTISGNIVLLPAVFTDGDYASQSILFYCHPQYLEELSRPKRFKLQGRYITFNITEPGLVHSTLQPNLPTVVDEIYFIDIFHDTENCTCVSQNVDATLMYNAVIKRIMLAELGDQTAANQFDITRNARVTWNYIVPTFQNAQYNKASNRFTNDLKTLGVTEIVAINKPSGVDSQMDQLMKRYVNHSTTWSAEEKRRRIAVVISGDRDFASCVSQMRQNDLTVMLIWNHGNTTRALIELVPENCRLGTWYDISGFTPPSFDAVAPTSKANEDIVSLRVAIDPNLRPEQLPAMYEIAGYVLGSNMASKVQTDEADIIDNVLNVKNEIKTIVDEAGGLQRFCNLTGGAICYVSDTQIVVDAVVLLRVFIISQGCKITASKLGEFYKLLGDSCKLKDYIKATRAKPFILNNADGLIVWTDDKNQNTGFGFLSCTTAPKKTSLSPDRTLRNTNSPVTNKNASLHYNSSDTADEESAVISMKWNEFNYIKMFAKDEVDKGLMEISRDVIMKLISTDDKPRICLSTYSDNSSGSAGTLRECVRYVQDYIKDNIKVLNPPRELRISRSKQEILSAIKPILDSKKVFCHVRIDSERAQPVEEEPDNVEVFVIVHKSWIRKKESTKTSAHANAPQGIDKSYIVSSIIQYMENYFNIKQTHYQIKITEPNPQKPQSVHVSMSFDNVKYKEKVLSATSTYSKVKFVDADRRKKDNLIGINKAVVTLVYRKSDTECEQLIMEELDKIEEDEIVLDVFPDSPVPNCSFRNPVETFFFEHKTWKYIEAECEKKSKFVMLTVISEQFKKKISLRGPKQGVSLIREYLISLVRSLLVEKIKIPKAKRTEELVSAIRKKLEKIRAQHLKREKSKARKNNDAESDDDNASLRSGVDNSYNYHYVTHNSTMMKEITLVTFPQNRKDWECQCDAASELIQGFTMQTLDLGVFKLNVKRTIKSFLLEDCVINEENQSVLLSGLKDRVEAAISFIEQEKLGQQPTSITIDCSHTKYSALLSKYLRLPHCKSILTKLRDDIVNTCNCSDNPDLRSITAVIISDEFVTGTDIIKLSGPQRLINAPNGIVSDATRILMEMAKDFELAFLPFDDWEVEWLASRNVTEKANALVDYITSMTLKEGFTTNEQIKYSCMFGRLELEVVTCDILETGKRYGCDILVNSANSRLRHFGGIAKLISDLDGPELAADCAAIIKERGSIVTGNAIATNSHNLKDHGFSNIIHAVPPSSLGDINKMRECVLNTLDLALSLNGHSVAIPGLGMGIYNIPIEKACAEIICAISEWSHNNSNIKIILFDRSPEVISGFVNALNDLKDGKFDSEDASEESTECTEELKTENNDSVPPSSQNSWFHSVVSYFTSPSTEVKNEVVEVEASFPPRKVEFVKPVEINDMLSPRVGIQIFATKLEINTVRQLLHDTLASDTKTKFFSFNLLRSYGLSFIDILNESNNLVRDLHVSVTGDIYDNWIAKLSGLGENNVKEAEYLLTQFENRKAAAAMRIPLPPSWGYSNEEDEDLPKPTLVTLDSSDPEYQAAKDIFFQGKPITATITKIERVQNVDLYRNYTKTKQEIARRNRGDANEIILKHGTKGTDPINIWNSTYGFDFRHAKESSFYGRGSYFTDDVSYAKRYAFKVQEPNIKQIFLARVAAGKHEERSERDESIKTPIQGCDSVRGPITPTGSVYAVVVYTLRQSYPEYLVTFTDSNTAYGEE